jgi:putative pyrroloquinoline-quinone-binding quinoprotein
MGSVNAIFAAGLSLLVVLPLEGGHDWPMFRRNPAQTGVAEGTLRDDFEVRWTFEAGGAIVSSPVVVDGRVYFGCDDQKIRCLRLSDGKEL